MLVLDTLLMKSYLASNMSGSFKATWVSNADKETIVKALRSIHVLRLYKYSDYQT